MNLLFMANNGLPRNGLIALYDPYRDTYGRNILPVGNENFVTGWEALDGSVQTITQNQTVAEWNTDKATRIQSTAGDGTSRSKYYTSVGTVSVLNAFYGVGCKVKNIGTNPVNIYFNSLGYNITINPNEIIAIFAPQEAFDPYQLQVHFRADIPTNGFDIIAYQPQLNLGALYPYSPPAGLLQSANDYSQHGNSAQLGSTAGADTNDPKFNGVALVGDGVDDYAVVPLASAAYRISVVDSGSGYVVVDEVPAYLNLFKTGAATYLNGKIGPTAYYNRVPTAAEIAQAKRYFKRLMAGRGVTVS